MNRPPELPQVNAADGDDECTRAEATLVPDLASDDGVESAVEDFEPTRVDGPGPGTTPGASGNEDGLSDDSPSPT